MDKIILPVFLISCFISNAQFTKGDKFIGGSVSIGHQDGPSSSTTTSTINSISLSPSLGFLVSEKFALGGQLGFSSFKNSYQYSVPYLDNQGNYSFRTVTFNQKSNVYSAGFFALRYFTISERFIFALTGNLSYSRKNNSDPNYNTTTGVPLYIKNNSYSVGVSISPSLIFFPSNNWGISAGLGSVGYSYGYSLTFERSSNAFDLNYGSFHLGFSYYFRKASKSVGVIPK